MLKAKVFICLIVVIMACQLCLANPVLEPFIVEFSVDPPWIEVFPYYMDLTGCSFRTMAGEAVVLSCEPDSTGVVLLNSSNTTGFTLNPQGDSIIFPDFDWGAEIGYGIYGEITGAPPPGVCITAGVHVYYPDSFHSEEWLTYDYCLTPTPGEFDYSQLGGYFIWGTSNLIINEVCVNNAQAWLSNFIELYNAGDSPVFTDNMLLIGNSVYDFPDNPIIEPGEFYVIDENDFPAGFNFDLSRDVLRLVVSPNSDDVYPIVDQVGWSSSHGENVSFMRYPDGDVNFSNAANFMGYTDETSYTFEDGFPTPGYPNRLECPGFVVINTQTELIGHNVVIVNWIDPIWENDFELSVLVRRDDRYPESPDDGDVFYEGTDQQFEDRYILPNTNCYYTIFAKRYDGSYSIPTDESRAYYSTNGINPEPLPTAITSLACYPNPFNAYSNISFTLAKGSYIKLSVYDITGRLVDIISEGRFSVGEHTMIWNASEKPSGIYFAHLDNSKSSLTRKLVLLK